MAAGGVRQPMVFQGKKLQCHVCVLNTRWFMLSREGGAIVERDTHVICDVFRGSCRTGSISYLSTDSCVRFNMRSDYGAQGIS